MKINALFLILLLCLSQTGCVTHETIQAARGYPRKDANGQEVPTAAPEPAKYWLVPLTVAVDAVLVALTVPLLFLPRPVC